MVFYIYIVCCFVVYTQGVTYEVIQDRPGDYFECNSTVTIRCMFAVSTSVIEWKIASDVKATVVAAAQCFSSTCHVNPSYAGKYNFTFDRLEGVSNITIMKVTAEHDSLEFRCDDGSVPDPIKRAVVDTAILTTEVATNPTISTKGVSTNTAGSTKRVATNTPISTKGVSTNRAISTREVATNTAISTTEVATITAISTTDFATNTAISTIEDNTNETIPPTGDNTNMTNNKASSSTVTAIFGIARPMEAYLLAMTILQSLFTL